MAKQDISHEEVWDDSALVRSWDEALEEYKKYHSLAAKGERVDLVLAKVESGELEDASNAPPMTNKTDAAPATNTLANGSVAESITPNGANNNAAVGTHHGPPQATAGATAVPQALMNGVQDEGLKNIMMSWYYAGYYTGLYEGQQKAYASMQQGG